jgi:glucokinase
MDRTFVVVSGLPGSGKTTLARQLANQLGLPVIDKDDILDRLFEARGAGDFAWRRRLSRESDIILEREALASNGAILASLWRVPDMAEQSGTPIHWLRGLSNLVVNVACVCPPETAAKRFVERKRHPGIWTDTRRTQKSSRVLRRWPRLGRSTSGHAWTSIRLALSSLTTWFVKSVVCLHAA